MKNFNHKSILTTTFLSLLFIVLIQSCKTECEKHPDSPDCINNEEELLTTMKLIAFDSATGAVIDTFAFADADNNGIPERFDTIRLNSNTTYEMHIEIWNESVSPAESITEEVREESNDHFFAFNSQGVSIAFTYIDFDTNTPALPLGLQTYWRAASIGNGQAHIVLKHQPGTKDGTETPGDTDMEIEFQVQIQ